MFFFFNTCVLEIKLRSLCLHGQRLTYWETIFEVLGWIWEEETVYMQKEGVMSNGEQDQCHRDQKHGQKLAGRKQRTVPGAEAS